MIYSLSPAPPTQSRQSWSHLKTHLSRLDKDDFLLLLHDLYALNADNKVFLATRFFAATPDEMAAPYRRIIQQVFNPDRGMPSLQLGAARKALNEFKKACADPLLVIDFMLFYVEQGVTCTNSYGDIDAPFYQSLFSVYRDAAELTRHLANPALIEQFRPRFTKIIRDLSNVGWGIQDAMVETYWDRLPETENGLAS
ncbi:MAG: DUF6155 family protein [Anaerolineae bacterium]